MKSERERLLEEIRSILSSQYLAVLATRDTVYPYPSLVGFAASDDLKSLFFSTGANTRKYLNMLKYTSVSMLIDSRSNKMEDFEKAVALTALGEVRPEEGPDKPQYLQLYQDKLPGLRNFSMGSDRVFMRLDVRKYILVSRLSKVAELDFPHRRDLSGS